jgi:hypothetical protein
MAALGAAGALSGTIILGLLMLLMLWVVGEAAEG